MTPLQNNRYWRKWGDVRKLLTGLGEFSAADADAERKTIQAAALGGVEKSSKDLTNKELDKVYDAFDAYLVLVNGPKSAPEISQPCKRLIWFIERLGLDEPYLAKIAADQFKVDDWRKLDEDRLGKFRFTCVRCAAAKRRAAK
jgi:hypothetical protein